MTSSNPALVLSWAIALDAQHTRGATTDMYGMARHFGLERVNYPIIPRFLSHMRSCKGMSKATRECASDVFSSLTSKNSYNYSYTCPHCASSTPWDMTAALGPLDQLYARFNVDIKPNRRTRGIKRSREEEETAEDEEEARERKRVRSEDSDEIIDLECTVALLADVIKVY